MLAEREEMVSDIAEARRQGARLMAACEIVGVSRSGPENLDTAISEVLVAVQAANGRTT